MTTGREHREPRCLWCGERAVDPVLLERRPEYGGALVSPPARVCVCAGHRTEMDRYLREVDAPPLDELAESDPEATLEVRLAGD